MDRRKAIVKIISLSDFTTNRYVFWVKLEFFYILQTTEIPNRKYKYDLEH